MAQPTAPENDLTIEQLAAESGMTVRNIRSHRARGLLPAPEVRDRVGYYGPEHLDRLRMIQELQTEGFNLKGIERLLEPEPGARRAVPLLQAGARRVRGEEPQTFTREELAERFGTEIEDALKRAVDAGALVPIGDDRFEAPFPSLLDAAEGVVATGRAARSRPRRDRQGAGPLQVRLPRVRQALPRGHLEALRRGGLSGGALARGPRRAGRSCARSRCRR